MFKKRGVIDVDVNAMSEDDIMMLAIDAGADDIVTLEDVYEIYTMPGDMSKVREALENAGIEILSSEIDMIPDNEIEVDPKHKDSVIKLIDKLEELDDVQDVFHNAKDLRRRRMSVTSQADKARQSALKLQGYSTDDKNKVLSQLPRAFRHIKISLSPKTKRTLIFSPTKRPRFSTDFC